MRGLRSGAWLVLALLSCHAHTLGAALVHLHFTHELTIECVKLRVTALSTNATKRSAATQRDGRDDLYFGLSETEGFSGKMRVEVLAWTTPDCSGAEPAPIVPAQEVELTPDAKPTSLDFDIGAACAPALCPPPAECFSGPATCLDDGGCGYQPSPQGLACDGGTCSAGACTPRVACTPGASCDDGLGCTANDSCSAAGVCTGAFACQTAPQCRRTIEACDADGGCALVVDTSLSCTTLGDAGVCVASGGCLPRFGSISNLDPLRLNPPTGGWVFVPPDDGGTCAPVFNTSTLAALDDADAGHVWCANVAPVAQVVTQDGGAQVAVVALSNLVLPGRVTLQFVGDRPVALVVYGDALVQGVLSVGSSGNGPPGAGGDPADCGRGSPGTNRGGGGGGAFGSSGGTGDAPGAGAGASSNGNPTLTPLRGGCSGGEGVGTAGGAGLGGGALQLSVAGRLTVNDGGVITASGAGGKGGDGGVAGGGGGSGGALLLEMRDFTVENASLTANGGAGGEGSDSNPSDFGQDGEAGHLTDDVAAAGGAGFSHNGGNGGRGAATGTNAGNASGTSGNATGGGGGAGRGRIRVNLQRSCTAINALVSGEVSYGGTSCPP